MPAMTTAAIENVVPDLNARLERIVARERLPGLAVGIVGDQELIWSGGFGHADRQAARPPDRQTLFRVASITKTFTAAAIVQLRDEGRLSLDDPLHTHIPEFAAVPVWAGALERATLRRMPPPHSGPDPH